LSKLYTISFHRFTNDFSKHIPPVKIVSVSSNVQVVYTSSSKFVTIEKFVNAKATWGRVTFVIYSSLFHKHIVLYLETMDVLYVLRTVKQTVDW